MKRRIHITLDDIAVEQGRHLADDKGLPLSAYVRMLLRQEHQKLESKKEQQQGVSA